MHSLKFVSKGPIKKAMKGDQNIEFLKKQFSEAVIFTLTPKFTSNHKVSSLVGYCRSELIK